MVFRVHVAGEPNGGVQQCERCEEVLVDNRPGARRVIGQEGRSKWCPAGPFAAGTFLAIHEVGDSRSIVVQDRDADPAQGEVQCDEGRRTGQARKERGKSLVGLTIPARVFAMALLAVVLCQASPLLAAAAAARSAGGKLDVLPPQSVQGVTDPKVTQANIQETICKPNYTAAVRNVTESEKKQVYARDGVAANAHGTVEVDHLISLELGGANDINNLWAQRYEPFPGARDKDKIETALHRDVCAGKLSLKEAQSIIRSDWYAEYKRRFGDKRVTK